ncbi:hypothetical protein [Spartinivicinus poritis]|uniref:Uncharacterized protein n=1 Tax=Spartinivicinus poritis TaxID=2994640 RepID=A0ABT5UG73_9GAMM|nr:hypothetical protein [Spartinivicinus sp. A2-2]MDE1465379.1 hypothetical protein [Spartinivicinus sp. A2-2]
MKWSLVPILLACFAVANASPTATQHLPKWAVKLNCKGWSDCYAVNNGSYGNRNNAKTFTTQHEALQFVKTFTKSLLQLDPQVVEIHLARN